MTPKVEIDRWLFDRLVRDCSEVASMAGSMSGAGHSVATLCVVDALGLLPADVSAEYPELVSSLRVAVASAALRAEFVEAVGEVVERASWAEREARAEEYYRRIPAARPSPDRYRYRK